MNVSKFEGREFNMNYAIKVFFFFFFLFGEFITMQSKCVI